MLFFSNFFFFFFLLPFAVANGNCSIDGCVCVSACVCFCSARWETAPSSLSSSRRRWSHADRSPRRPPPPRRPERGAFPLPPTSAYFSFRANPVPAVTHAHTRCPACVKPRFELGCGQDGDGERRGRRRGGNGRERRRERAPLFSLPQQSVGTRTHTQRRATAIHNPPPHNRFSPRRATPRKQTAAQRTRQLSSSNATTVAHDRRARRSRADPLIPAADKRTNTLCASHGRL